MLIGKWGSFKAIHRICKERTQTYTFIRVIYSPRGKRYLMVFYVPLIPFSAQTGFGNDEIRKLIETSIANKVLTSAQKHRNSLPTL